MNWHTWSAQQIPITPIQRGGAAVWSKGADRLNDDPLGPIMHLHDDASEIFYFVSGQCRLEIGNSEQVFQSGDFVLVPPGVPHNVWNAADEDLLVFWIVAPNVIHNKWRTEDFPPGAMERDAIVGHVAPDAELPSNEDIRSTIQTISNAQTPRGRSGAEQELVLYVLEGPADIGVGHLNGLLGAHQFVHVPSATAYSISAVEGDATVIMFEMPGVSAQGGGE